MAAAAILNYRRVILDHPRTLFMPIKLPFKFRVDWITLYFLRYEESNISQIWLKFPVPVPKKSGCWEVFTSEHYFFYNLNLQKALRSAKTRVCSPYWSLSVLWCDLQVRRNVQKKGKNQKYAKNRSLRRPPPVAHVNRILRAGLEPGYLSPLWSSERSVGKCGRCGTSKFWPSRLQGISLIGVQAVTITGNWLQPCSISSVESCECCDWLMLNCLSSRELGTVDLL